MRDARTGTFRYVGSAEASPGSKPGDRVMIGKLPVTVVSQKEGEKAEFVVCTGITMPLIFPDNRTGPCKACADPIQWRPHAPQKPPKLCLDCAQIRMLKDRS